MRLTRARRAVSIAAAAGVIGYAAADRSPPPLELYDSPHRSAAGTWDDGRSMAEAAATYPWWWRWLLLSDKQEDRTRAITFGAKR